MAEEVSILSVPEGKRIDFITKQFVNDTPEEYVRQNIEKACLLLKLDISVSKRRKKK